MPPADELEITDPRAMRALAHPARLSILELLHVNGTANATECARELGGSPQAASYHLRALAKWGLVKPVESSDGRETRWELAALSLRMESGDGSPQFQSAARVLGRRLLERDEKAIDAWLAAERDEPREWRDAATFNSGSIYATPAELRELGDRMRDLIKPYERPTPEERPDGARRIHVAFRGVPRVEPRKKRRKS